jgi:ketosteroid isomerase-like protein
MRQISAPNRIGSLLLAMVLVAACGKPDDATQIEKQLELYAGYVRTANHFGIASLFTDDGVLEPGIRGAKAIQQHLTTTSTGLKVIEYAIDPSPPVITGDTADQTIVYQQQLRTPQGNTTQITGKFTIRWQRAASGRWLIARLATSSAPQP